MPSCFFGQSVIDIKIIDCSSDSLVYADFLKQLDSLGIVRPLGIKDSSGMRKLKIHRFSDVSEDKLRRSDFCSFLFYVKGFNRLLDLGLDLNFDYAANLPINSSTMLIGRDEKVLEHMIEKNKALREKHRIYRNFLSFKKDYERYIVDVYLTEENKVEFYNLIDSVILYGTYSKPETLRKILRSEFRHLSRDKLNQDIRKYFNENN